VKVILQIGSMNPASGGPPRVVAGSAAALARRGHQVDIFSIAGSGVTVEDIFVAFPDLRHEGVGLELYPPSGLRQLGLSRQMSSAMEARAADYDAVHVHGVWEQALADSCAIARRRGVPTFVSAHGMLDRWSMDQSRQKKWAALRVFGSGSMLRGADAIIYGTLDEMQESQRSVPGTSGVVVPNGVKLEALTAEGLPPAETLHEAFPVLKQWQRTVLYFSRIHPKKGLDLLVDGFLEHALTHPGAGLLVAGIAQDLAYEAALRARIASSPVSDRIVFTTDLTGPHARVVFRQADIFALPSHQEGLSIAILEAMALEKALLISDRCHMPEVEATWDCGIVVRDNRTAVAAGLGCLLAMPANDLKKMGVRARRAVEENFSWDSVVRRLELLYSGRNPCAS
jgi:glycosyltransferase involved in cell wall biosynthesis